MEENKIYVENCINTMGRLSSETVDLIVTSPPYDDMDETFNPVQKNGLRAYKEGYNWDFKAIAAECFRILKQGGVMVWVVGDPVVDGSESLASSFQKIFFRRCGFNIHDTMIYEKNGGLPDATRYVQTFEYMIILSKGKPKTINFLKDRRNRWTSGNWGVRTVREKGGDLSERKTNEGSGEFGKRFNIWRYFTGAGYSTTDKIAFSHPAIYPEKLAADHILTWSNEGDLIFDPFGGSGTTAKMSHLLKRRWIISEISPEYAAIAEERLKTHFPVNLLF